MRKINDLFIPSATDIKKAQAHARAIERRYPEYSGLHVDLHFQPSTGCFYFDELSQSGYIKANDSADYIYIDHSGRPYGGDGREIDNDRYIADILDTLR